MGILGGFGFFLGEFGEVWGGLWEGTQPAVEGCHQSGEGEGGLGGI